MYDPHVDVVSTVVTLFLTMDPLGNIPLYISVLAVVPAERRRIVVVREVAIAYLVLLTILLAGNYILQFLRLDPATISISGGIVLFLIALRMIFPAERMLTDALEGEPFVVPLAIPLFAGPSVLAALLLIQRSSPGATLLLFVAMTAAWAVSALILFSSTFLYRILQPRGLIAIERLMGMLLVMVAVQMFTNGLRMFLGPR